MFAWSALEAWQRWPIFEITRTTRRSHRFSMVDAIHCECFSARFHRCLGPFEVLMSFIAWWSPTRRPSH